MKILYINHYAGTPSMGMEYRPWYLASCWQGMGHEVKVLASTFSHLRNEKEGIRGVQEEMEDGVPFIWVKTPPYKGNGINRVRNIFSFLFKIRKARRRIIEGFIPDLVISSSTYPLDIHFGKRIARECGAKLVHEVHDIWPLTLTEIGGFSRMHPFILLLQKAENKAYRSADKVVSVLPCAKEHMVEHGMAPEKFVHIPNGIDPSPWQDPSPIPEEHEQELQRLEKGNKILAGYAGGHGLSNDLDQLLDAAKRVRNEDLHILMVGDGPQKERLQERIKQEGILNVSMLPSIRKGQIPALLSRMDFLVLTMAPSPLYRFGMGLNKWFDYMMAGKPVVQALESPNDPIEEAGCGTTVPPGSVGTLAQAMEEMGAKPVAERERMGTKGKTYVQEHHSYQTLARRFLEKVMGSSSPSAPHP